MYGHISINIIECLKTERLVFETFPRKCKNWGKSTLNFLRNTILRNHGNQYPYKRRTMRPPGNKVQSQVLVYLRGNNNLELDITAETEINHPVGGTWATTDSLNLKLRKSPRRQQRLSKFTWVPTVFTLCLKHFLLLFLSVQCNGLCHIWLLKYEFVK